MGLAEETVGMTSGWQGSWLCQCRFEMWTFLDPPGLVGRLLRGEQSCLVLSQRCLRFACAPAVTPP